MLTGTLKELPLLGLLERLMAAQRTGVLHIETTAFKAAIYMQSGQPVHAEAGNLVGYRALEFIVGLQSAPFRFAADSTDLNRTLVALLETQSRMMDYFDGWQSIHLPQDWSVIIRTDLLPGEATLDPQENAVLGMADGQPLAQMLLAGELGPLATAKIISRLLTKGYIEAEQLSTLEPAKLRVLTMYGAIEGVAVLDQSLYDTWRKQFKYGFVVKVRANNITITLKAEPRDHFGGHLGLFKRELRQFVVRRGQAIEVWPEPI